jgi:DNA-binding transcriptional LysR family regulator
MIQMDTLTETAELLAFVHTVDARSLSRAAVELGLPRVTVSRRLARLEERLGVRLVRRTTRRLALTDAGEELYRRARVVLGAVREAEAAVRRTDGVVRGLLRVSAPPSGRGGFNDLFLDFLERYPEVRLEVEFAARHVDLVGSGYDVAIRASSDLDPGLIARSLARIRLLAVASPAYLARAGVPETPADLARHACLVGFADGARPVTHWPLVDGGKVRVEGALASNALELLLDAALRGRGIAFLPELLIQEPLRQGAIVQVLAGAVGAMSQLAVVYAEREFLPPVVRAFVNFVAARSVDLLALAVTPPAPAPCPRAGDVPSSG